MNIIVIGAGRLGYKLVEDLSSEDNNITVIDTLEDNVEHCVNYFDVLGVTGNGASYDVQLESGVKDADIVLTVTESDEKNILCSMIARKIGAKRTIARVRNAEYYEQIDFLRNELGIDVFINPDLEASKEIARVLRLPHAIQVESFADGRINLVELYIKENSKIANLRLTDIAKHCNAKILICAVLRDGEVYIPKGDFVLLPEDKIYVSASHENICAFMDYLGLYKKNAIKTVLIIGGGRITYYTAKQLLRSNMRVKIIEADKEKCIKLDEMLGKATIIHGDGTDQDLLDEENIENVDAVLALTGDDKTNVIISMYADYRHVSKVITKISGLELGTITDHIGLDTIITPKNIVSDQIVSYVRANSSTLSSGVQTLYKLVKNKAEALEFHVSHKDKISGSKVKNLDIKDGILIACINKGNKIIIPTGDDIIEENDKVLIVTTLKNVRHINDIF